MFPSPDDETVPRATGCLRAVALLVAIAMLAPFVIALVAYVLRF